VITSSGTIDYGLVWGGCGAKVKFQLSNDIHSIEYIILTALKIILFVYTTTTRLVFLPMNKLKVSSL
jgi:hypothetical protein